MDKNLGPDFERLMESLLSEENQVQRGNSITPGFKDSDRGWERRGQAGRSVPRAHPHLHSARFSFPSRGTRQETCTG